MNLAKWFPFQRKNAEVKRAEAKATPATAITPTVSPLIALNGRPEPFALLQEMLRDPFAGFGQLDRWFGDHSAAYFDPKIDVVDEGKALRITAELPGLAREDVELKIEENALVLQGEKKLETKTEEEGCYRLERAFGSFERIVPLPVEIDREKIEAKFDKGVLTIRAPKLASALSQTKKIEIKAS